MRTFLQISSLLLIAVAGTASYVYIKSKEKNRSPLPNFKGIGRTTGKKEVSGKSISFEKLNNRAEILEQFSKRRNLNNEISFLIDMNISSGSPRFFVYNLQKDSVETAGLVTHGYGSISRSGLQFSNVPGSNASSLGKYKIGNAYMGRFGLAYKLHGLDKTNDKAYERFVVLHAHDCVPDKEVPYSICESQGCPTVSPEFLQTLKRYIERSNKPILLEIYQ